MQRLIIGLAGRKQSGKDTVCKLLGEMFPHLGVRRIAFADALKEEVAVACGVSRQEIDEQKDRYRMILQWWGTEFRRHDDEDYWVRQAHKRMLVHGDADLLVITDARFPNELEFVHESGGEAFWIERPGDTFDAHTSEHSINPHDCLATIKNTGTLFDLQTALKDTFLMNDTAFQLWRQLNELNDSKAQAAHAGAEARPAIVPA